MDVATIINWVSNVGIGVFLVAYFVYRDYKFTSTLNESLSKISHFMEELAHGSR